MSYGVEHYNNKWKRIISGLPNGSNYRYDLRQYNYDFIKGRIPRLSKIFDFGCGLGIIDIQLFKEKDCDVYGCDTSNVAVDFINSKFDIDRFCVGDRFFGKGYDYILAIHFIEHISNPVEWMREALEYGKRVIFTIPNNFRCSGEHENQQWHDWNEFHFLFQEFNLIRLDGLYPECCKGDWSAPIFEATNVKENYKWYQW